MKKSSSKPVSPANYVRTRARSLPIYECWVNASYKQTSMATVTVARKHSNGNITMGNYLVDLLCMGVKDTGFKFNIPIFEYEEFKEDNEDYNELQDIDYNLAHNIIFAGVDFAAEIGLDACKDFISTTQFLLEEDNDDIPLIDIECGMNGKPVIIKGPHNIREANALYAKLSKTIGVENFIFRHVEDPDDPEEWDDDDDDDDDEFDDDEFDDDEFDDDEFDDDFEAQLWQSDPKEFEDYMYTSPLKERHLDIKLVKRLEPRTPNLDEEDTSNFAEAINRLFYNHFGYEKVDEAHEQIYNFFDLPIENYPLPDAVLGFDHQLHPDKLKVVDEVNEKLRQGTVNLLKTAAEHPDIPYFKYLFLMQLESIQKQKTDERLKEYEDMDEDFDDDNEFKEKLHAVLNGYRELHPDYQLFKLIEEEYGLQNHKPSLFIEKMLAAYEPISDLFPGRRSIGLIEAKAIVKILYQFYLNTEDTLGIDSLVYFIQKEHPSLGFGLGHIMLLNMAMRTYICKTHYLK